MDICFSPSPLAILLPSFFLFHPSPWQLWLLVSTGLQNISLEGPEKWNFLTWELGGNSNNWWRLVLFIVDITWQGSVLLRPWQKATLLSSRHRTKSRGKRNQVFHDITETLKKKKKKKCWIQPYLKPSWSWIFKLQEPPPQKKIFLLSISFWIEF